MNLTGQKPYLKNQKKRPKAAKVKLGDTPLDQLLALAREKGTDAQFLDFIRTQPSCLSLPGKPQYSEYVNKVGRNIAAHVRRAREAGTGMKPPYSAVPLTFDQHNIQSWEGEAACLNKFLPRKGFWSNLDAKEQFDKWRVHYLKLWIAS